MQLRWFLRTSSWDGEDERRKERYTMDVSPWSTRIGPIISVLGGLVIVTGFCLPLFVTSPPIDPHFSSPYPLW